MVYCKKSWAVNAFLLLVQLPLPFLSFANGLAIRSELLQLEQLRTRLAGDHGQLRYFVAAEQTDRRVSDVLAGFSSPFFTFGPVSRFGLLRELFNPLGFSPGSSAFFEKTQLSLNGAFQPDSRRGVVWEPLPEHLGLFMFHSDNRPVKGGALFCLPLGEELRLEGTLMTSMPEDELDFEQWFAKRAPFSGGSLVHAAGKLGIDRSHHYLNFTTAACSGDRVAPGLFTHLSGGADFGAVLIDLLLGLSTASFIDPDGEYAQNWLVTGAKLNVSPWKLCWLTGAYTRSISHGALYPDRYREGTDEFELDAELAVRMSKHFSVSFEAGGDKRYVYHPDGDRDTEEKIGGSLLLEYRIFVLRGEWIAEYENGGREEQRYRLEAGLHTGRRDACRLDWSAGFKGRLSDRNEYFLFSDLDLTLRRFRFYARIKTEKSFGSERSLRAVLLSGSKEALSIILGGEVKVY